jgi:hypothetical protein
MKQEDGNTGLKKKWAPSGAMHAYNPRTLESEAGIVCIQGCLGYIVRPCVSKKQKNPKW